MRSGNEKTKATGFPKPGSVSMEQWAKGLKRLNESYFKANPLHSKSKKEKSRACDGQEIKELEREAFTHYNAGRHEQAKELLERLLKNDPKHTLANFYLKKIQQGRRTNQSVSDAAPDDILARYHALSGKRGMNSTKRVSRKEIRNKQDNPSGMLPTGRYTPSTKRYVPTTRRIEAKSGANATARLRTTDIIKAKKHEVKKSAEPVKVMIVDDSPLMRKVLTRMLEKSAHVTIVGTAVNGQEALEAIPKLNPDLITLDVNMPVMDGITALKHIIVEHALPVIMLSAFTEEGAFTTFDCLTYGAVDFICKPSREGGSLIGKDAEVVDKIISARKVKVNPLRKARLSRKDKKVDFGKKANATKIIAMGAGEGGYGGFLKSLPHLPENLSAAILGVQYMEDRYFDAFCDYLNQHSKIAVKKAEDEEPIKQGVCYLTNHKQYLKIKSGSEGYLCQLAKKPDFLMQQNVFNHLLFSTAETCAGNGIAVVFAGKGIDGLEGIREVKRMRGVTLAQDPKSCITSQLSEISINSGNIDHVVADADFPGVLWHLCKKTTLS